MATDSSSWRPTSGCGDRLWNDKSTVGIERILTWFLYRCMELSLRNVLEVPSLAVCVHVCVCVGESEIINEREREKKLPPIS